MFQVAPALPRKRDERDELIGSNLHFSVFALAGLLHPPL